MLRKQWLFPVVLLMSVHSAASAEWLIGVKAGVIDIDAPSSDPGINGSVQVGYEAWDLGVADIAIEGELSTSLVEAEVLNNDVSFETLGVYASIRTAGPIYAIGRVGIVNAEIENTDDTDTAIGIGIGFSTGLRCEIEYTSYEVEGIDVDYISVGFSF